MHWFTRDTIDFGRFDVLPGGAALSIGAAHARDYFNPALLEIDNPALRGADLSVFEENNSQAPGTYRVDLYLNGEQVDSLDVEFRLMPTAGGKQALQPCFSAEKLAELG